jgi:hypothetical protein
MESYVTNSEQTCPSVTLLNTSPNWTILGLKTALLVLKQRLGALVIVFVEAPSLNIEAADSYHADYSGCAV